MSGPGQKPTARSIEIPSARVEQGIHALREAAKNFSERDPNAEFARLAANVDVQNPLPKDRDGLFQIERGIKGALVKIAKKHPKLNLNNISARNLARMAEKSGVKLDTTEIIALSKLQEIRMNPTSETARQLQLAWPGWIEDANTSRLGLGERYLKNLKENPGGTLLLTALGGLGIYAGAKIIGWLYGKAKEKIKAKVKENIPLFASGGLLGALGAIALGVYKGESIKDWLLEQLGITDEKDKLEKILAKLKKAKSREEIERLKQEVAKLKEKADSLKDKGKQALERARGIKEEGAWALVGREVPLAEKKRAIRFSEMLESQKLGLSVLPEFFAVIGNLDYQEFIDGEPSAIEMISNFYHLIKNRDKEAAGEIVITHGTGDLIDFFTKILKNDGEIEKFKGKTVYEVMELIHRSPGKYIDKEAVAKAQEENEHLHSALAKIEEGLKNPEKMKNQSFWEEVMAESIIGGITYVIPKLGDGAVWVMKNGWHVATIEHDLVRGTLQKIAEEMTERDSNWWKAPGMYLHIGAYTAAIGAPLGAVTGFARSFMRVPSATLALKGAFTGTIRGAYKGLIAPGKASVIAVKGLFWDIPFGEHDPRHTVQAYMDQQRFIFEDLKLGSKWGNKLGFRSLPEKILAGEVTINDRLIRRLNTYKTSLKSQIVAMEGLIENKLLKKAGRQVIKSRYTETLNKINRILDSMAAANGKEISPQKWLNTLKSEIKLGSEAISILEENRRLGILLLEKTHPLSRIILDQKNVELLHFLHQHEEALNALTREPGLINDPQILARLKKLNPENAAHFQRVVLDRAQFWKNTFRRRELNLLRTHPSLASNYVRLSEKIANPELSAKWMIEAGAKRKGLSVTEFLKSADGKALEQLAKNSIDKANIQNRLLQKVMLNTKMPRAQFIYTHINDLGILFENSARGQKAIDLFLAIDDQLIKVMRKDNAWAKLGRHFKELSTNKEAIEEITTMVAKYEKKVGIIGHMSRRLSQMKAGLYEKVGEKIEKGAARSMETIRKWRGLRLGADHIDELSKAKNFNAVKAVLEGQDVKLDKWAYRMIAQTNDAETVKYIIREATKQSGQYVKFVRVAGFGAKALKVLKPAVPVAFGAAAFIGAGLDFYQAHATKNMEKRNLYLQKGGINTAAGAIDVAMLIGGAGLGATMAATAAVAPPLYMIEAGYQSALESETKPKEWSQTFGHETLIHHWISTGRDISAGESYRIFFTDATFDSVYEEYKSIRRSIAKGILLAEGERFEKENEYRVAFLETTRNFSSPNSFTEANSILHQSRLFAEAMHTRTIAKANKLKTYPFGDIDLMDATYELEKMKAHDMFKIAKIHEKQIAKEIVHPVLAKNFEKLSTGELVNYYFELDKYMQANKVEVTENETYFFNQLKHYLFYVRKVDANKEAQAKYIKTIQQMIIKEKGELPNDPKKLKLAQQEAFKKVQADFDDEAVLSSMHYFETGNKDYLEIKEQITDNEACYALFKLAESFGYSGLQNEEELKAFFNEGRKTVFGVYWDGESWYVNAAGWKFDDEIGPELNRHTIETIISELRRTPENRLEHRQEAIMYGMGEIFKEQVLSMADILENGLSDYSKTHKKEIPQLPLESLETEAADVV